MIMSDNEIDVFELPVMFERLERIERSDESLPVKLFIDSWLSSKSCGPL